MSDNASSPNYTVRLNKRERRGLKRLAKAEERTEADTFRRILSAAVDDKFGKGKGSAK